MNIALIDQNPSQAEKLAGILKGAAHDCVVFKQAYAFLDWWPSARCDLLMLNSTVNDVSLQTLLHKREQALERIPILLMVESLDSEMIVSLLETGLDDYCVLSALRPSELVLRVQVLLRRAWPDRMPSSQLKAGPYIFDTQTMRLKISGREVRLAQKEFELALLLFQHLGQPLSRATILDAVWGLGTDVDPDFRSVDTHIARIRRKLNLRAGSAFQLSSVYGYGYVLEQQE